MKYLQNSYKKSFLIFGFLIFSQILNVEGQPNKSDNQLANLEKMREVKDPQRLISPTPPMGWNSWNWFGKDHIDEKIVKEVIDAMVEEGLKDAGYEYVVIDGGWRDTVLAPDGKLRPNPTAFPHGIKALADYAHSKGLKLGVHTAAGTADCGGDKVGGYGHEKVQVKQFVDWGIDFVKLDKCRMKEGWNEELVEDVYRKWGELLKNSRRDIVLSISAYRFRDWNPEVCQMSRTTGDLSAKSNGGAIFDTLQHRKEHRNSVMKNATINNRSASYAGHGYWNNPDMLSIGAQGLSVPQQKAEFALWCIMSSPLIIGNDPRNMTRAEKSIILNRTAIKIDQDTEEQGKRVSEEGYKEIWLKHLSDGKIAVLLLNRNRFDSEQMTLHFNDLGISDKANIKRVYDDEDLGLFSKKFSRLIQPQSGLFLILKEE